MTHYEYVSTISIPTIGAGIYKVPFATVTKASYNALERFTAKYSFTSQSPLLQTVYN